ncbi:UDP-glycosyltransferase 74F2 [Mucuna pruriens]|uniref:UDP-glycosyltransferase 74F2 n=1 Tax=Mucuna pruriens TaxID=157652 RepID=A0A371F1F9_MUCPR|nr:UDP-glycosyltransferase 74F2 [Mucuna pruriens]
MEKDRKNYIAHCLVVPYPAQGHINPMLQFSKRLMQRGVKVTLVTVVSNWKTMSIKNFTSIHVESISDGYDDGGLAAAESLETYINTFWRVGSQTLALLVQKLAESNHPADCVIYDALLPWALDVAKKFGLLGAAFFTQSCTTNNIYFQAYKKLLELPLAHTQYLLPGLPKLAAGDLPSFLNKYGSYPAFFDIAVNQFANIDKADWVLANTFYELEQGVVDWLVKIWPLKAIGPSLPSMYLDRRLKDDKDYGVNMYNPNSEACIKWLDDKPKGSVVYVSFGSMAGIIKAVADEKEIVRRETITHCIKELLETEKGNEIKKNSIKWKNLAKSYVDEGGNSDKNTKEFVDELAQCCAALN